MISQKEVQHVAQLARLGLDRKEIVDMQEDLSSILDYIEKLKEVDIKNVDFYISLTGSKNVTREDKEGKESVGKSKKLLDLAPQEKGGFLKVKQIF